MRRKLGSIVTALALVFSLSSCGGDDASTFPPGLEPLETSTAVRPTAAAGQQCPEAVNVVTGEASEYTFAHGRGCVHGTLAQVWEAMRDPDVGVDRRRVGEWTVTRNVEPQYPVSFRVHNVVHDIIDIEFDLTWRLGPIEGTNDEPRVVSARYQKTYGSTYIQVLAGSVVARPLDTGVVELEVVRHLKGTGVGAAEAELYLRDFFASVVARVHGAPLPRYN
jgi:hypothetical protein